MLDLQRGIVRDVKMLESFGVCSFRRGVMFAIVAAYFVACDDSKAKPTRIRDGTISKTLNVVLLMSEMDVREAIVNMLEDYTDSFSETAESTRTAQVSRDGDMLDMSGFRCDLKRRTFTYRRGWNSHIYGEFFVAEDGRWTGKVNGTMHGKPSRDRKPK